MDPEAGERQRHAPRCVQIAAGDGAFDEVAVELRGRGERIKSDRRLWCAVGVNIRAASP
jgi:hypothetical protein